MVMLNYKAMNLTRGWYGYEPGGDYHEDRSPTITSEDERDHEKPSGQQNKHQSASLKLGMLFDTFVPNVL
jgi:hypothetical protein